MQIQNVAIKLIVETKPFIRKIELLTSNTKVLVRVYKVNNVILYFKMKHCINKSIVLVHTNSVKFKIGAFSTSLAQNTVLIY